MTEQEQEKKNKRIAALSTAGIQVLVVLLLFVIIAWRAPNPPLPEYGIELNFGLDTEGSGDIQPETPVGNEGNQPEESTKEEQVQEEPEVKEEAVKEKTQEADIKEVEDQPVSKVESPVVVKEKEPEKLIEKSKEKAEEKKVEKQPEVKKEQPKAIYKPDNEKATAEKEGSKEGTPGNQGDDKDKTGDKGSPEGKLDAKALYGQPGGGGGGVSMSGFNGFDWPKVQTPSLPDEAFGVYEFIVKVDAEGTVVKVTPVQRGLSLEAQQRLKDMIQQLEFIPKGANLPAESEGRITFKVVSK
jgi:periplasmic protein TonB